ncbi:tRNA-intron lyase [Candidatus Pacearchaeota archaeon]|nr:tRNA-intron lyase [Candidatus Pacearchaeota archaeon]
MVKKTKEKTPKKSAIKAVFSGEIVYSNKKEAFSLYEQSRFGEAKEGKIFYSFAEALYLLEREKIEITSKKKKLSFQRLIEELKKEDPKIETKYRVFKDLRDKGYIVKTALKFGAEFRVYDKGIKPGEDHAKWIIYPVKESETLTWHDFSAKNRVAHSTKKNLLIGIVDEESDVTYYEVSWTKP